MGPIRGADAQVGNYVKSLGRICSLDQRPRKSPCEPSEGKTDDK